MDPLTCLHLQMQLEGKALVGQWSLRQVEAVPGEELPLVLTARLSTGEVIACYDEAIPPHLQKKLTANRDLEFPDVDPLIQILKQHDIAFALEHYKTYIFPLLPSEEQGTSCLSRDDPKVKAFEFDHFGPQVYAAERDGKLASACVSVRANEKCAEAWVFTDPAYRHRGFAQAVVRAWARGLMKQGKIPFYSHRADNLPSARLANRLGLQLVFEQIAIVQREE
jgi:RimJ/RimL family protein N-acetyltransferase